jgi:predicted MFS family arabinose efflux permease
MVFGTPLAGWLHDRYSWKYYVAVSMLIMAGALTLLICQGKGPLMADASFVPLGIGSALF